MRLEKIQLEKVEFTEVRGTEGIKEAVYNVAGMDMDAFGKNPTQNELGKMPLLLLVNGSLRDMNCLLYTSP